MIDLGITYNNKKKSMFKSLLIQAKVLLIITCYNLIAYNILSYFRCVDNITIIIKIIIYHKRFSLLHRLVNKCSLKIF